MHTAQDIKELEAYHAHYATYFRQIIGYMAMNHPRTERVRLQCREAEKAVQVAQVTDLTPQHDYTIRFRRLHCLEYSTPWRVYALNAKRALLHARNHDYRPRVVSSQRRAYERYRKAWALAQDAGVSPEDFLAFWRSL